MDFVDPKEDRRLLGAVDRLDETNRLLDAEREVSKREQAQSASLLAELDDMRQQLVPGITFITCCYLILLLVVRIRFNKTSKNARTASQSSQKSSSRRSSNFRT